MADDRARALLSGRPQVSQTVPSYEGGVQVPVEAETEIDAKVTSGRLVVAVIVTAVHILYGICGK